MSHFYWQSPLSGGGGGQKSKWQFSVPYYLIDNLPLEQDLDACLEQYAFRDFDPKLPVLDDDRRKYTTKRISQSVSARVFYSWQSDLPNATNRGFIERALDDAARSIREDRSILVEPVVDRDTVGVPGSPDIVSTILDKIDRSDVFVCDISIINPSSGRPAPNPNVLIELGYALKSLGPHRIIMVLNTAYGGPELLPFDLRMRRVIPYEMQKESAERAPARRELQSKFADGLRAILGGESEEMPGELIEPQPVAAVDVTSFLEAPSESIEPYITRVLTTNNEAEFNIAIEKLREPTVTVWSLLTSGGSAIDEEILRVKNEKFLPALRKLVQLGLFLIKFSGPVEWFRKIADLLEDIFLCSHTLARIVPEELRQRKSNHLDELANHIVPALEALIATYLIAGFEITAKRTSTYAAAFFPRIVQLVGDPYTQYDAFYLYWPIHSAFWQPNRQRDLLAVDRYGSDTGVTSIIGEQEAIRIAILQADCLIYFHSFMGNQSPRKETSRFFLENFPSVPTFFCPNFTHEQFSMISPLIELLWKSLKDGTSTFILDARLATVVQNLDVEARKNILAAFLLYADKERSSWMFALGKHTFPHPWAGELGAALSTARAKRDA